MSFFGFLLLVALVWFIVIPLVKAVMQVRRARRDFDDILRGAFGPGSAASQGRSRRRSAAEPPRPRSKKRFGSDVGEYVTFEDLPPEDGQGQSAPDATDSARETDTTTVTEESQITDVRWEDLP